MVRYNVHVEDSVDYCIPPDEAINSIEMVEDLALEFWAERIPKITITTVEE